MKRSEPDSPDEVRRVITRVFEEVWNQGQVEVADDIFVEGQIGHAGNGTEMTVQSLKETVLQQRSISPQLRYVVDQFVIEGVWVATRWTGTGIGRDDGSTVSRWGMTMWRMEGSKIAEAWVLTSETPPSRH
jgi:predicted ester cyclase